MKITIKKDGLSVKTNDVTLAGIILAYVKDQGIDVKKEIFSIGVKFGELLSKLRLIDAVKQAASESSDDKSEDKVAEPKSEDVKVPVTYKHRGRKAGVANKKRKNRFVAWTPEESRYLIDNLNQKTSRIAKAGELKRHTRASIIWKASALRRKDKKSLSQHQIKMLGL